MNPRVVDQWGHAVAERSGRRPLVETPPPRGLRRTAAAGDPATGTIALLALGVLARLRRWAGGSR